MRIMFTNSCKKLTVALALATILPAQADLILHYDMEEASGNLVDQVGGLEATPVDAGHTYSVAGPAGFGNAVSLGANGSWQLSVADSGVFAQPRQRLFGSRLGQRRFDPGRK